ncbi:DUF4097 family beta strand repeat-containing protein [Robiginitalea sp. SC105]|uniref:DUF4097 family beta strand repeat-containing protein n=1 Tax=Robiginitalea sp. SC105 TaxID=2762332 RepID=UPI001639A388|nr:DUF4097 family beta strand repeat-containing protein [Robiginitalea sp. SC105]MBC2839986.1 hypothetical protein [Robiginitalea sp. SC105]
MNQSVATASKALIFALLLGWQSGQAQKSKTYKESFNVDADVEVALNTSHADIEFETWNRNEVAVEAVITLEGATDAEAAAYFENGGVEIMGNSSRVEVSTRAGNNWAYRFDGDFDPGDFNFVMPEIPDIGPILESVEIPDIGPILENMELPPMPPVPFQNFDYEAYEKEGEAYMKRWKTEFDKKFDKEYQQRLEEWSKRAEERAKEMKLRMEEQQEARELRMKEREKLMEERAKQREEAQKVREEARAQLAEAREQVRAAQDRSRVFFMQGESGNGKYTIKKTIRIKMPKGARLKLNVRHGEVKLAENSMNLRATLNYASLRASTIDGDQTLVDARYSPIAVKSWNRGRLNTDFSEDVNLYEVRRLDLSATSSQVTIERLLQQASIRNNLGALRIGYIANGLKDMTISVDNGQLQCKLPDGSYHISVQERNSEVDYPGAIVWDGPKPKSGTPRKGYHIARDSGSSIVINASYSQVELDH